MRIPQMSTGMTAAEISNWIQGQNMDQDIKQYRQFDDIIKSIDMLSALRKIHILFGESEDATKLKNTIDALRAALEADEKKKEMQKKKKDDKK